MLKASDCIFLEIADLTEDLNTKGMFGVVLSRSKYSGFPIMQLGLIYARWRFYQSCLAKSACSACLCDVFQIQLYISEGE